MQSHPIKFKCGHERALPLDERGEDLKAKIKRLEQLLCGDCVGDIIERLDKERGRDER